MTVLRGVKEFKTELTALSISVCAMANKKGGIPEPNMPDKAIHLHCIHLMGISVLKPTINRKKVVKNIRNAPTCNALSPIRLFLIRIKELPQIIDKIKR